MKLRSAVLAGLGGLALALFLSDPTLAQTATAQAAPVPTPNKGDTTWMLVATILVLMMSVPGIALFYGGLVRTKNMLSLLTQVFAIVCLVCLIWVLYGYSMAFSGGGGLNSYVGGLSKAFLRGVTSESTVATFSNGVVIPEYVYMCFQMTFAMITPALIVGGFAERIKFSALVLFIVLWVTLVYFPIAHMVWYWAGPDAVADAAKALAGATDAAAKAVAQTKLDEVKADAGLAYQWGALDFAGGTVVHINAGIAGFVGALMLGRRIGYGRDLLAPHSLTMTMIGASLLWVGWFGFNAGSNLEANGTTALAMVNTFVATAAAALALRRMGGQRQAVAARHAVGRDRGPCGRDARVGLCRPDGLDHPRPRGRRRLLPVLLEREERVLVRRLARRVRHPLCGRHPGRARDRHPGQPSAWRRRHPGLRDQTRRARHRGLRVRPRHAGPG